MATRIRRAKGRASTAGHEQAARAQFETTDSNMEPAIVNALFRAVLFGLGQAEVKVPSFIIEGRLAGLCEAAFVLDEAQRTLVSPFLAQLTTLSLQLGQYSTYPEHVEEHPALLSFLALCPNVAELRLTSIGSYSGSEKAIAWLADEERPLRTLQVKGPFSDDADLLFRILTRQQVPSVHLAVLGLPANNDGVMPWEAFFRRLSAHFGGTFPIRKLHVEGLFLKGADYTADVSFRRDDVEDLDPDDVGEAIFSADTDLVEYPLFTDPEMGERFMRVDGNDLFLRVANSFDVPWDGYNSDGSL